MPAVVANDPTSAQRKVITDAFSSFGYQPSEEEIVSLENSAWGAGGPAQSTGDQLGKDAVSQYVNTIRQLQDFSANNPLKQVISDEKGFFNSTQSQAADLLSQATGAPKLFGGMSPEQIDQYLAPVYESSKKNLADVEGAYARRGGAGSSTESQSLAEQNRLYKENVLSTGLSVGMAQQDKQQQMAGLLYGQLPGIQSNIDSANKGMSDQNLQMALLKSSLPSYLNAQELQTFASRLGIVQAMNPPKAKKNNPWPSIAGEVVGGIGGFMLGGPIGGGIGAQVGGQIGNTLSGNDTNYSGSGNVLNSLPLLYGGARQGAAVGGGGGPTGGSMTASPYGYSPQFGPTGSPFMGDVPAGGYPYARAA